MDLQLAVKAEYFHQIKSGEKTLEYRLLTDYWCKRLEGREYDQLIITLGYPRKDDADRRIILPYRGFTVCNIQHKHFGPQRVRVYAIHLTDKGIR